MQGTAANCLATKRSWQTLNEVWPALVQARYFEKPSVLRVIDEIINKVFKSLETFSITMQVSIEYFCSNVKLFYSLETYCFAHGNCTFFFYYIEKWILKNYK